VLFISLLLYDDFLIWFVSESTPWFVF